MDNGDLAYFKNCYQTAKDIDSRIKYMNENLQRTSAKSVAFPEKYSDTDGIPLKWSPMADVN